MEKPVAGRPQNEYEIFFGVNENSCKDNHGNYRYKRDRYGNLIDEAGIPVLESNKPAAIEHDLMEISAAFKSWAISQQLSFARD